MLFLGTDGAGKSTLIKRASSILPGNCVELYLGMGQEGWMIPGVSFLYAVSRRRLIKKLRASFLFWYLILPVELLYRRSKILFSCQYHYLLIDRFPGSPFIKGGVLERLYKIILPSPDLVILLTGDASMLAARKSNETTLERTTKELEKWRIVADNLRCKYKLTIDTSRQDVKTCSEIITNKILDINNNK